MNDYDTRAGELLAWSAETGLPLPLPIEEILQIEDAGHVVDLESGGVIVDGGAMLVEGTVIGEAWDVVSFAVGEVQP